MNFLINLKKIKLDEKLNVLTHFFGLILSIIGAFFLLKKNIDQSLLIANIIYLTSLISVFTTSTFYHASQSKLKHILRKFDHISIFFLIAGTYTPFCLLTNYYLSGKYYLILIWAIAIFGVISKIFFFNWSNKISLILYLVMGWVVIFDINNIIKFIDLVEISFLLIGGIFYTFGVFFYKMEKIKFNHSIWHVFVVLGALFHYLLIYKLN